MLRVVVAVVAAVALVGVSVPAVDSARVDHADARVAAELDRVETAAQRLWERNDPAPSGLSGARRTLTLHLPERSWGSAGLDYLTIPAPTNVSAGADRRGHVAWRVEGGRKSTHTPSVRLVGPEGGLSLREGGRQRVVVQLARVDGRRVVVVRRPGFKSDDGTKPTRDGDSTSRNTAFG